MNQAEKIESVPTEVVNSKPVSSVPQQKKTRLLENVLGFFSTILMLIVVVILGYLVWTKKDELFPVAPLPTVVPSVTTVSSPESELTTENITQVIDPNFTVIREFTYPTKLGIITKHESTGGVDKLTLENRSTKLSIATFPYKDNESQAQNFRTTDYQAIWPETFRVKEKIDKDFTYYFYGRRSYYPEECNDTKKYCFTKELFLDYSRFNVSLQIPISDDSAPNLKFYDDLLLNRVEIEKTNLVFKGNSGESLDEYYQSNDSNQYYSFTRPTDYTDAPEAQGLYDTVYLINSSVLSESMQADLAKTNIGKMFQIEARCEYVSEGMPGINKCYTVRKFALL